MTRLLTILKGIDLTDLALIAGAALLWIGLGMLAEWAPFVTIGLLLVAYGSAPMLVALGRRQ